VLYFVNCDGRGGLCWLHNIFIYYISTYTLQHNVTRTRVCRVGDRNRWTDNDHELFKDALFADDAWGDVYLRVGRPDVYLQDAKLCGYWNREFYVEHYDDRVYDYHRDSYVRRKTRPSSYDEYGAGYVINCVVVFCRTIRIEL